MKKHYSLVKTLFFLVSALLVVQVIILSMAFDLRRIITTAIVVLGFIVTFIIMIILKREVGKIIYEYEDEENNYQIRLLEYDDYQHVRELMCEKELSNSQEEVDLLKEYDTITTDLIRTPYHYIVFDKGNPIDIIYIQSEQKKDIATFKALKNNNRDDVKKIISTIAFEKNRELEIKE